MSHASFDSSLPKVNENLQPPTLFTAKNQKKGSAPPSPIPTLAGGENNRLTNRATPIQEDSSTTYEKLIDTLIQDVFTNKKEELAAILEESQMEATVNDGDPAILIGDKPAFKRCIANLAVQLESQTLAKSDKKIKKHIQERFLQEAMPILQWQRQLNELDSLQETLKQEMHTLPFTGKQRKRISKELKETVRTTTLFLEQFGHPESRSAVPELPQVWTADHLLAKNQLMHSRLEQISAPAPSLKELKKEYRAIKDLLNEMQRESGALDAEQTGWLSSMAGWFASGIKRPQTEKDASDFTFIEHYHERIDNLHFRMALLADKFDKLNSSDTDSFAAEFGALHAKVKEIHAHMEFHIDYFAHEAALEGALMNLTDQTDRLMSNHMDFSCIPLRNLTREAEDFAQMIQMHRQKLSNPKILNEIEKKLEFQTQLINDKIEHFLEQMEAEMKAEFHESCAQMQANENNKEAEMYCLSALHRECTLFIEELDEFMEDYQHYFGDQDLPSITPLQNLANQIDHAVETLKGRKTREVDYPKLTEIRAQRTLITLDKQKRRWQKEHFEKMEAVEKPLSLVQRIFSAQTAKNAALVYLMQATPFVKAYAESTSADVKTPDQTVPKSDPTGTSGTSEEASAPPPVFRATTVHLETSSSKKATSSATQTDQAFWITWPEAASEVFSSFTAKSDPLKKSSAQTVAESLTVAEKKLEHLQSESIILGDTLSTHPFEDSISHQIHMTELEACRQQLNETASSIPPASSSIPDVLEFVREVESSDQALKNLQERVGVASPPIDREDIHAEDHLKRSSLHLALEDHDIEAAKKLVKKGADIFKKDSRSTTPLHLAMLSQDSDLLLLMLEHCSEKGVSVDIEDDQGNTPLHIAVESKNEAAVILLLKSGANPLKESTLNHRVPLFDAVKPGRINLLNLMLPHLPKNKDHDIYGYLLFLAAGEGNPLAINAMIRNGSDPYKKYMKTTFFHYAVQNNQIDFVKALIEYGYDVNDFKNEKRENPLFDAIRGNNKEMVELLLKAGANPHQRNLEGESSVSFASKNGNDQLVPILTQAVPGKEMIKLLSHSWELAGTTKLKGEAINLEGAFPYILSPYIMQTIDSFASAHPDIMSEEQRKLIEIALTPVDQWSDAERMSYDPNKVLEAIRANQPVFIPTGWTGHSIEIVIKGSYLMVCNRGEGTKKPIEIFKIDPNAIDDKFLRGLSSWKTEKDFKRSFPPMLAEINAQKDPICVSLENLNPLRPEQLVGNCSWESLETAIFGLLGLNELLTHPENNPEASLNSAYHTLESWLQYTKLDYLERYLLSPEEDEQKDLSLLDALYGRGLREVQSPDELIPNLLDSLNLNPCQYDTSITQHVCQNFFLFKPEFKPMFPLEETFHQKFEVLKLERYKKYPRDFTNLVIACAASIALIAASIFQKKLAKTAKESLGKIARGVDSYFQ